MTTSQLIIASADAMEQYGAELARACITGSKVIYLQGDLGAGKTTLLRGFLRELGYAGRVKSPTYTIVESYHVAELDIHHFDVYRLNDPEELAHLGIRDYDTPHSILLIEWPEKAQDYLPAPNIICQIAIQDTSRIVTLLMKG